MKDVIRRARTIRLQVVPVEVMVVNKSTVEDHAAVWFQRSCDYIGGFRGIAAVHRRTQLTFGIGLYDHTAEIRYLPVNFVELLPPPLIYLGIERIERFQPTYLLRHTDVHCNTELHAISAKHIGNPRQLWDEVRIEDVKIRIYVIDVASIDADGCQRSRILRGARQIGTHVTIVEENRPPGVAALNRAIQIVPLVHPTHGRRWRVGLIQSRNAFPLRNLAEKCKCGIQNSSVGSAGDYD